MLEAVQTVLDSLLPKCTLATCSSTANDLDHHRLVSTKFAYWAVHRLLQHINVTDNAAGERLAQQHPALEYHPRTLDQLAALPAARPLHKLLALG